MAWTEMIRSCGVGVLGFLLVGSAAGQAPKVDLPRAKALGEVRDKDGKAWVGVKVILVAWPASNNQDVGRPDCVETHTDERGRFRAQILEGWSYTVWAQSEPGNDQDRNLRVSNVAKEVIPQVPVLLKERKETVVGHALRIGGLETWADYKPLVFRWIDVMGPQEISLEQAEDGKYLLPPVIGETAKLEVLATGPHGKIPVHTRSVSGKTDETTVPGPAKVGFAVWNIDNEKPIEGARIYSRQNSCAFLLGMTGKDGFAEVVAADKDRRSWGKFFVVAEGRSIAPCMVGESRNKQFKKAHKDKKVHYHAHMGAGHKVKGRVFVAPDRPAAGVTLLLKGSAMHYTKKNSRSLSTFERLFETDAKGQFEMGSLLKEYPPDLTMVLAPEHLSALPAAWRQGLSPVVFAPLDLVEVMGKGKGKDSTKAKAKTNDIVLTDLCPVELVARTPMGIPAARAKVHLTWLERNNSNAKAHPPILTDRRGRVRLLLPQSAKLGLTIDTGDAYLLTCLQTRAVPGDRSIPRLEVKLPTPAAIRGQVVDSDGKGVEGVTLNANPMWQGRAPRLESGVDADSQEPLPEGRNGARFTGFEHVRNHHVLFYTLLGGRRTKTGKDGRFTLAVPRLSLQYQLHAYIRQDGVYRRANTPVHVEKDGAGDIELVLR